MSQLKEYFTLRRIAAVVILFFYLFNISFEFGLAISYAFVDSNTQPATLIDAGEGGEDLPEGYVPHPDYPAPTWTPEPNPQPNNTPNLYLFS